jgi:hypothetical protein
LLHITREKSLPMRQKTEVLLNDRPVAPLSQSSTE